MVNNSLSSDLDLIKEFEELKIKQKLLTESLKQTNNKQQNKLFLEINSKLDFLVKIFTEANKESSKEDEKVDYNAKLDEILERINNLEEKINSNNENSKINNNELKEEEKKNEQEIDNSNNLQTDNQNSDTNNTTNNNDIVNINNKENQTDKKEENTNKIPPPPEFETKIDKLTKEDTQKKKKKWF